MLQGLRDGGNHDLSFSSDGKTLATVGPDSALFVWDATGVKGVREYPLPSVLYGTVVLAPNGSLAAAGFHDGSIRLLDLINGQFVRRFPGPGITLHIPSAGRQDDDLPGH